MNAKVHDTIGVSPAELLYGKAINLYTGLLSPFLPESLVKGQEEAVNGRLSDHIAKLIAILHSIFNPSFGDSGPRGHWNLMQDSLLVLEV
jgi:hypothetical protein